MANCTNCGSVLPEGANHCPICGAAVAAAAPVNPQPQAAPNPQPQPQPQAYQQPVYQQPVYQAPAMVYAKPENPCDKMLGIIAALFGIYGVIIAYFGGDVNGYRSEYLKFFANQSLVMFLFSLLSVIPFIGWIWGLFVFVCTIIAIVNACKGLAKPVLFFGTLRIIK
ncbi:MAG: zinc ribbon domain-containing protein [Lachnospiraceae bacterium]|nr:zinc ribbon domain-containing protein [Lachnospiraceae bacterium]